MFKLTIDPGHGGKDPGAVGPTGVQEKVITLAVAKKVAAILQPVMSVTLTRYADIRLSENLSVDLTKRAELANSSLSDVFVSIHVNAAIGPAAHGTETHCYPGSIKGAVLAQCLQDRLVPALGLTDRGTKQSNFAVLRQSKMPAALVELAFISNLVEEKLLQSEDFQNRAALAIAHGICDFLGIATPVQSPDANSIIAGGQVFSGKLIDGQTWIPLRAVLEALGHKVTWDAATRTVVVE